MQDQLEVCIKDWAELADEYRDLELKHKEYRQTLNACMALQKKCVSGVTHQKYRLGVIKKLVKEVEINAANRGEVEDLHKDLLRRSAQLEQMQEVLPRKSGRYLRAVIGNVDCNILDRKEKYQYKEQYEQFKLIVNLIGLILAVACYFFNFLFLDKICMFHIVWYYCTLTIRESILIVNGSRIKGWWRFHHFISVVAGGILLVWPRGEAYVDYRDQHVYFNIYVTLLQLLQYQYQKGCLYRLRTLGERRDMDITIDGFHSWMWKGLVWLLPFLYFGYLFQLYNAYALYHIYHNHTDATWHVPALSSIFLLLGLGNILTTSMTIPKKLKDRTQGLLKYRFTRLDKYFWSHRKRRDSEKAVNPVFSSEVEQVLRRSNSDLIKSSLKHGVGNLQANIQEKKRVVLNYQHQISNIPEVAETTDNPQDPDENGSQTSEEAELVQEMPEEDGDQKKSL